MFSKEWKIEVNRKWGRLDQKPVRMGKQMWGKSGTTVCVGGSIPQAIPSQIESHTVVPRL